MWMVCCWQLIASNIPAVNTRVKMERIASNIAGNIARCGCPFMSQPGAYLHLSFAKNPVLSNFIGKLNIFTYLTF